MIKLTVLSGPDTGNVFALTADIIIIGRGQDCDVILHDSRVSRRHCKILHEESSFIVSDLRTPNGVFLNDTNTRISTHVLRNGDEIIFGGSRLRVELPTSLNETFLPTNPRVTIEDALSVQDSPASLPQNWQEGMTVFVSRAKLLAEIEKPLTATKSAPPVRESLCARLLAKVKRLIFFFKNSPLSQSRS